MRCNPGEAEWTPQAMAAAAQGCDILISDRRAEGSAERLVDEAAVPAATARRLCARAGSPCRADLSVPACGALAIRALHAVLVADARNALAAALSF